jgi:hypothetical protein
MTDSWPRSRLGLEYKTHVNVEVTSPMERGLVITNDPTLYIPNISEERLAMKNVIIYGTKELGSSMTGIHSNLREV